MKGWQFTRTGEPLTLVERDDPHAGPGEVVVEIKASGLCHSDVGALVDPGWMKIIHKFPVILGHEFAGVVAEVGEGVSDYQLGDRVGVCPVAKTSGGSPGNHWDGGYATKAVAMAEDLVRIPDTVSFVQAAMGTDAGMTSYHAVMVVGRVRAGMKIGIIGLGGLGQLGARAAVIAGAEVYGCDISESARALGPSIGVRQMFSSVMELEPFELDVIIDYAGFGTTTAEAILAVRPKGRVVQVGMGVLEATIDTGQLILKQVELAGSMGGTVEDIRGVYDLFASGQLNPQIATVGFDEIPEGLERLRKHEVQGRLVANLE
jgi:alcohol dehydrogenase, propanol-preferring